MEPVPARVLLPGKGNYWVSQARVVKGAECGGQHRGGVRHPVLKDYKSAANNGVQDVRPLVLCTPSLSQ